VMDQRKMMHNNVEGFRQVLDLAVGWGSRVVWASSAATYGRGPAPMKESQRPEPLNVYGYSKLAMEHLARRYAGRLPGVVGLRYFNVYGPGEAHKGKFASMIGQLARQMKAGKRPRIFYDGEQKRDFVYIDDVIAANLAAMKSTTSGVFNVGSGQRYSILQIAEQMAQVLNKPEIEAEVVGKCRVGDIRNCFADIGLARDILGFQPEVSLEEGLTELAEWLEGQTAVDNVVDASRELAARGLAV